MACLAAAPSRLGGVQHDGLRRDPRSTATHPSRTSPARVAEAAAAPPASLQHRHVGQTTSFSTVHAEMAAPFCALDVHGGNDSHPDRQASHPAQSFSKAITQENQADQDGCARRSSTAAALGGILPTRSSSMADGALPAPSSLHEAADAKASTQSFLAGFCLELLGLLRFQDRATHRQGLRARGSMTHPPAVSPT
jgi:hypothetical protein